MKIELKNLKIAAHLSEETTAYTATVYVDGKKAFHAQNDGHGGCDRYDPIAPFTYADLQRVSDWAAKETGETFEPLDGYIGDLIDKAESEKRLNRILKSKIVILGEHDGAPAIFTINRKPDPATLASYIRVKGADRLVNGNPALIERARALV